MSKIKSVYRFLSPKFQSIHLEYKVDSKPRYGHGKPAHPLLLDIVNKNRELYKELLHSFLQYSDNIHQIRTQKLKLTKAILYGTMVFYPAWILLLFVECL